MAETVSLTKSEGGDYELIIGGYLAETFQFPRFEYVTNEVGVKLKVYNGRQPMKRFYKPSEWAINFETGFTTVKQVTDILTELKGLESYITNDYLIEEDSVEYIIEDDNNTNILISED